MIDAVWIAFVSGIAVGAALLAIIVWLVPALRDLCAERRGNAGVIDLAAARRLKRDLAERRARGRR